MNEKTEDWRIQVPAESDLGSLFALEADVFGDASWGQKALEDTLANDGNALVCHSRASQHLAGMLLWRPVINEAELLLIGVTGKARRKGVGKALLKKLVSGLIDGSFTLLHLEVRSGNIGAIDFYKQQGFEVSGRRPQYYANGDDAVLMRLSLA